jgi:glycosyltransferase involved in cell wall biosynthesis
MRWADVVHLTATYNFPTLPTLMIARLLGRPVVWSPRGALQATEDWDAAPRKRAKALFAQAAQALRPAQTILHTTSPAEAASSARHLPDIETTVIPNCVDIPDIPTRPPQGKALRLMYLGRLHPKKGLDLLFDAMTDLPANVALDVYGTGDADYVATLKNRTTSRINLHGHADGAAKTRAFENADLFILPSHSENFGIAVAEALAHAVPVVTTQDTPWQGLDHHGCGRWIDLKRDDLAATITELAGSDLRQMGMNGRAWMQREFTPEAMAAAFERLYRGLLLPAESRVLA